MAKDKLIPTWLKIAGLAALLVPYSVKLERDEEQRIKKVSAKSIAARVTYTAAEGDKSADLDIVIPGGIKAEAEEEKSGISFDSGEVVDNAKRFCKTAAQKAKSYAAQTKMGLGEFCAKLSEDAKPQTEEKAEELEI